MNSIRAFIDIGIHPFIYHSYLFHTLTPEDLLLKMMHIVTGIDIVDINRFKKVLATSGKPFTDRVFLENESRDKRLEHLAGIFAVASTRKLLKTSSEFT